MKEHLEHCERVKRHCVKVFSLSPLYQARAAKNPNYWNELGMMGRWLSARRRGIDRIFSKVTI